MNDEERFWSKVDRGEPQDCWNWKGGSEKAGYGTFYLSGGNRTGRGKIRCHRYALQLKLKRPLSQGAVACHLCNNRACVNPDHLYEGDHRTNARDRVLAGTGVHGALNSRSHLTDDIVLAMIATYMNGDYSQSAVGEMYGIPQSEVSLMLRGRSWKHVTA